MRGFIIDVIDWWRLKSGMISRPETEWCDDLELEVLWIVVDRRKRTLKIDLTEEEQAPFLSTSPEAC